jgi:hypothetical protein
MASNRQLFMMKRRHAADCHGVNRAKDRVGLSRQVKNIFPAAGPLSMV